MNFDVFQRTETSTYLTVCSFLAWSRISPTVSGHSCISVNRFIFLFDRKAEACTTPRAKTIRSPRRSLFLQRAGLFPLRNGDCRIADRLHRQQAPLSDSDASILSVREFSFADRHFVTQGDFCYCGHCVSRKTRRLYGRTTQKLVRSQYEYSNEDDFTAGPPICSAIPA